jgi:hypothetical protein
MNLLIAISAFAYSGGNGTKQNPWLISSRADMEQLAANVNGGQSYSGIYFKLIRDLTEANDVITTMIGNSNSLYFSGIFDGDGHTLEVKINTANQYAGVFGYTEGAIIKNLGVSGSVKIIQSYVYVGSICGRADNTVISNCYNTGEISATYSSAAYSSSASLQSGGICGITGNDVTISSCYNTGKISASGTATSVGAASGGICGWYANNVTVSNCYNTGVISASGISTSASISYSGGICGGGINNVTINNCYNTGGISSSATASLDAAAFPYSGGICGYGGSIQNCFVADCRISTNKNITGRIVGNSAGGSVTNCYADGDVRLNNNPVSSSNADSKDGKDETLASLQSQSWLSSILSWDFNIWRIVSGEFPTFIRSFSSGLAPSKIVNGTRVSIYPSPASHDLYIQSNYPVEKVEIYNQSGVCVLVDEAFTGRTDVSHLPAGVYYVRVYVNGVPENRKIIVEE